jgi:hypothetical protein
VGTIGIPSWTAAKLVGHNGLAMWLLRIIFLPRNPPIYRWECQLSIATELTSTWVF